MNLFWIVDKWNNILYSIYNILAYGYYLLRYPKIHSIIKANKRFKNKHKGARCFIILNGPSLSKNDVSTLSDEFVFCANYFYRSSLTDVVRPNYYCWMDSCIFKSREIGKRTINEVKERCPDADVFLNFRAHGIVDEDGHTFFTYNKHLPSTRFVKINAGGFSSGFTNVLGYILGIAIFMGFKEINILGLDFEPGGFKHFQTSVDGGAKQEARNYDAITHYGSILKAHSEFIGINKYAQKKGVTIRNLNPDSYVRAFSFSTLDDVLKNK